MTCTLTVWTATGPVWGLYKTRQQKWDMMIMEQYQHWMRTVTPLRGPIMYSLLKNCTGLIALVYRASTLSYVQIQAQWCYCRLYMLLTTSDTCYTSSTKTCVNTSLCRHVLFTTSNRSATCTPLHTCLHYTSLHSELCCKCVLQSISNRHVLHTPLHKVVLTHRFLQTCVPQGRHLSYGQREGKRNNSFFNSLSWWPLLWGWTHLFWHKINFNFTLLLPGWPVQSNTTSTSPGNILPCFNLCVKTIHTYIHHCL